MKRASPSSREDEEETLPARLGITDATFHFYSYILRVIQDAFLWTAIRSGAAPCPFGMAGGASSMIEHRVVQAEGGLHGPFAYEAGMEYDYPSILESPELWLDGRTKGGSFVGNCIGANKFDPIEQLGWEGKIRRELRAAQRGLMEVFLPRDLPPSSALFKVMTAVSLAPSKAGPLCQEAAAYVSQLVRDPRVAKPEGMTARDIGMRAVRLLANSELWSYFAEEEKWAFRMGHRLEDKTCAWAAAQLGYSWEPAQMVAAMSAETKALFDTLGEERFNLLARPETRSMRVSPDCYFNVDPNSKPTPMCFDIPGEVKSPNTLEYYLMDSKPDSRYKTPLYQRLVEAGAGRPTADGSPFIPLGYLAQVQYQLMLTRKPEAVFGAVFFRPKRSKVEEKVRYPRDWHYKKLYLLAKYEDFDDTWVEDVPRCWLLRRVRYSGYFCRWMLWYIHKWDEVVDSPDLLPALSTEWIYANYPPPPVLIRNVRQVRAEYGDGGLVMQLGDAEAEAAFEKARAAWEKKYLHLAQLPLHEVEAALPSPYPTKRCDDVQRVVRQ